MFDIPSAIQKKARTWHGASIGEPPFTKPNHVMRWRKEVTLVLTLDKWWLRQGRASFPFTSMSKNTNVILCYFMLLYGNDVMIHEGGMINPRLFKHHSSANFWLMCTYSSMKRYFSRYLWVRVQEFQRYPYWLQKLWVRSFICFSFEITIVFS